MKHARHTTRRRFIAASGRVASTALLGPLLLKADRILAAPPSSVRRNVRGMDANDPVLASYRTAITAMKALPASNPLSWDYQAAIHGTTLSGSSTAWNTCEHGSMFFWSWHRIYLYYFERIVRKMSKNPCWALPYWDWAPGNDLFLPAPFRDPASALFNPRATGLNDGTASLNPLAVAVGPAFSQTSFYTASSIIEGPHGSVHGQVSGNMCCVPTAALDPIFYLHHSNVDRLWNLWLAQGGGRTDPVLDAPWTSKTHTFFDANGAQVTMNACQVLRAAQQLHYVYEGEPPQVLQYCRRVPPFPWWKFVRELIVRLPIPPIELGPEPVTFPIDVQLVRERVAPLLESKTSSVLLELDDVEAATNPGVVWAVFVGLPAGAAPDAKSPHFVGQLALFGSGIRDEKHHGYKPAHFTYPITRALQESARANNERIEVSFVPLGLIMDGRPQKPEVKAPVRIGKASLVVEKATEEAGQRPAKSE